MRNSTVMSSTWEPDISRGECKSSYRLLAGMYTAILVTNRYVRPKLSQFSPIYIQFNIFHPPMRLSDWSHFFRHPKKKFICSNALFSCSQNKTVNTIFQNYSGVFFLIWNIPYSYLTVKTPFMCISNNVHCRKQAMCNSRIIQIKPFCSYAILLNENEGKIHNSVVIIGDRKIGVGFPASTSFFSSVWCPEQIEAHSSCCCLPATAGFLLF